MLKAFVTEANYQDRAVGSWVVPLLHDKFPRLKKLWADGAYRGEWLDNLPDDFPIDIEIVEREPGQRGFTVIPWRWVVERTFAWLNQYRRLSKDAKTMNTW